MSLPIIDLHCDLLSYLAKVERATPNDVNDIGAAIPYLTQGNVKVQVMALYSGGDTSHTNAMADWFVRLEADYGGTFRAVKSVADLDDVLAGDGIGIIAAIENGSNLVNEDEPLDRAFERFERLQARIGPILYVGLTHHGENRFGGGNKSAAGLKPDGAALLDFLSGRRVAIDLAHTSDPLAYDIIRHVEQRRLDLPFIASHSNYRAIWDHPRNLPDDLAQTVIRRNGLIGMNLLRAFLNDDDPTSLTRHIAHGIRLGGEAAICFGADYFATTMHPDSDRHPFYHPEHENAGKYPAILDSLKEELNPEYLSALAFGNAAGFIRRLWG
jgi:membrane dipeptidase